jgi:predicted DNA-binding transcriptional regulator AlpA
MPIYRGHMDIELPISTEVNGGGAEGFKPKSPRVPPEEILLDAEDVSIWLNVSEDWVWDHASRRAPFLPAIWLSDGALRFRRSKIAEFIAERERLSSKRRRRR